MARWGNTPGCGTAGGLLSGRGCPSGGYRSLWEREGFLSQEWLSVKEGLVTALEETLQSILSSIHQSWTSIVMLSSTSICGGPELMPMILPACRSLAEDVVL
jgi:hypothetical protein